MSVFDPSEQNIDLDKKIVAGLERLSQVFRALLWDHAKAYNLSPIQIQLLIFIRYHRPEHNSVSYLAGEFSVTKPTISDASFCNLLNAPLFPKDIRIDCPEFM